MHRPRLPAITSPVDTPHDRLARAVAGHGFGSQLQIPAQPVEDDVFEQLVRTAEQDRLLGALAELVANEVFPVTAPQHELLAAHHAVWQRHALLVERLLLDVADCFGNASIDFRVIKGPALARIAYTDPSWRIFADLDLLIPSTQFDEAVRLARTELDGVQEVPELRLGFDQEFGKEALIRVAGIELDLHRTFVTGPFGLTIDLDRLFDDESPLLIGGRKLPGLGPTALFLHACYNVALGDLPVKLGAMRDLLVLRAALEPDIATIAATARAWRCSAVVSHAARLTRDILELDEAHELDELARLPVPTREVWLLGSYFTAARSYSRPLASLAVIPGVRARVRYVSALVAPSAEYLRSRGWTERGHMRRACGRLLRRG